VRIIDTNGSG